MLPSILKTLYNACIEGQFTLISENKTATLIAASKRLLPFMDQSKGDSYVGIITTLKLVLNLGVKRPQNRVILNLKLLLQFCSYNDSIWSSNNSC